MLTEEALTAEIQTLKEQVTKAQQQLAGLQQQCAQFVSLIDQLLGAVAISEKYLQAYTAQASVSAPNGLAPEHVAAQG